MIAKTNDFVCSCTEEDIISFDVSKVNDDLLDNVKDMRMQFKLLVKH